MNARFSYLFHRHFITEELCVSVSMETAATRLDQEIVDVTISASIGVHLAQHHRFTPKDEKILSSFQEAPADMTIGMALPSQDQSDFQSVNLTIALAACGP